MKKHKEFLKEMEEYFEKRAIDKKTLKKVESGECELITVSGTYDDEKFPCIFADVIDREELEILAYEPHIGMWHKGHISSFEVEFDSTDNIGLTQKRMWLANKFLVYVVTTEQQEKIWSVVGSCKHKVKVNSEGEYVAEVRLISFNGNKIGTMEYNLTKRKIVIVIQLDGKIQKFEKSNNKK